MKRTGFDFPFCEYKPYHCHKCGPTDMEPVWHVTARQTRIDPEDGVLLCGNCGAPDSIYFAHFRTRAEQKKRYKLTLRVNPKSLYI